jgi:hypothetical protein
MSSEPSAEDVLAVRRLTDNYGLGVDTANPDLFVGVFTDDGILAVYEADEVDGDPVWSVQGREELYEVPKVVAGWHNTMHLMANHYCELNGDVGTGLVYGLSLHLKAGTGDDNDTFMIQRYRDQYRRVDGKWLISRRDVLRQWTEDHVADRRTLAATLAE